MALLALLGVLFGAASPGLALAAQGGMGLWLSGPLSVFVCHAGDDRPVDSPDGRDGEAARCCVICQAAHLSAGALPAASPALAGFAAVFAVPMPAAAHRISAGPERRGGQARAPPGR